MNRLSGGRTWWAHFEFTRINIEPIILQNKIEDLRILWAFCASDGATSLGQSSEVAASW